MKKQATAKPASKPVDDDQVDLAAEEKRLRDKYPDVDIVRGSITDAGTVREFGNKRTVEIKCSHRGCAVTRRVATSDLHQVRYCTDCIRQVRLERRKDARSTKPAKPVKTAGTKKTAEGEKPAKVKTTKLEKTTKVVKTGKPARATKPDKIKKRSPKPIRETVVKVEEITTNEGGSGGGSGPDELLERELRETTD